MSASQFLGVKLKHYSMMMMPCVKQLCSSTGCATSPYDHVAFRTFRSDGGIHRIGSILTASSEYKAMEELAFPSKNVRAQWFKRCDTKAASALEATVPTPPIQRVFVSEFDDGEAGYNNTNFIPKFEQYQRLLECSDYAAWTLAWRDTINHVTLTTNALYDVVQQLQQSGAELNASPDGKCIQTSRDRMLHQASIKSPMQNVLFSTTTEGFRTKPIPGPFIEFIQRDVDSATGIERDGFETENALHIFDSTLSRETH